MTDFLLECFLAIAVISVAVCYCAAHASGQYSRLEETEDFERWWKSWNQPGERDR